MWFTGKFNKGFQITGVVLVALGVLAASDYVAADSSVTAEPIAEDNVVDNSVNCGGLVPTIVGTGGADRLLGTNGRDVIHGYGGDDIIYGFEGNDVICGGSGNDTIYAVAGNNVVYGDSGDDLLRGGSGNDKLNGGAGHDTLSGSAGKDILNGDDGNDILNGWDGDDTLNGGAGDDNLNGGTGNNILNGNEGNDNLTVGDGRDVLNGGAGNDLLNSGNGNDLLYGGSGADTLNGGNGNDRLFGEAGGDLLRGGDGDDYLSGGSENDELIGGSNNDTLFGGPGLDSFSSGDGSDTVKWFNPKEDRLNDLALSDTVEIAAFQRCDQPGRVSVGLPVFNNTGLNEVRTNLHAYLCPGDTIALISGNKTQAADPKWVNQAAAALVREFAGLHIVALTSGMNNVKLLARSVDNGVVGYVGYIYEPNWENTPEFTWDFLTTLLNVDHVVSLAKASGLSSWAKPTGRPLLQSYLFSFNWDYGELGKRLDGMAVQTQTYCRRGGVETFARAMDKLVAEFRQAGVTYPWYVQIAFHDIKDRNNAVPLWTAIECAQAAVARKVPGVFPWWSSNKPNDLIRFLRAVGR